MEQSTFLCACGCGAVLSRRARFFRKGHYARTHTYTRVPVPERFWPKVDRRGPDECWPWLGARAHFGHGQIGVPAPTRTGWRNAPAHRVAWELTHGPIPDDLCCLHRCDNPPCCNPAHLFLGTQLDNVRDRVEKGRTAAGEQNGHVTRPEATPRGAEHRLAKLTDAAVRDIRARYAAGGISQQALADEYGVSQQVVSHAVRRLTWRHVT